MLLWYCPSRTWAFSAVSSDRWTNLYVRTITFGVCMYDALFFGFGGGFPRALVACCERRMLASCMHAIIRNQAKEVEMDRERERNGDRSEEKSTSM